MSIAIAVLGPGGVGGLVAGALEHHAAASVYDGTPGNAGASVYKGTTSNAGAPVTVVARESTVEVIEQRGLHVSSVRLGEFLAHPRAVVRLLEPVDVLVVTTKAIGLAEALERVAAAPRLVLPLLNGLEHLPVLRARFGEAAVVAGTIRVEADRPEPGVVVHTSPFLRIDMASRYASAHAGMQELAQTLTDAGIPARVQDSEPQVLWSKLVRLNALACTTSAFDKLLGEIRSTPELRAELVGAIEEGCAVALAEGAAIEVGDPLGELTQAHATLGSSMQRDIAAGRVPELDAIPGAVLRAGARHGIECPTIERLVAMIAARAGVPVPVVAG